MGTRALTNAELQEVFDNALEELAIQIDLPLVLLQFAYDPFIEGLLYLGEKNENVNTFLQGGQTLAGGDKLFFGKYIFTLLLLIALVVLIICTNDSIFIGINISAKENLFDPLVNAFRENIPYPLEYFGSSIQNWVLPLLNGVPLAYEPRIAYDFNVWPLIFSRIIAVQTERGVYTAFTRFFSQQDISYPSILLNIFHNLSDYEKLLLDPNFHDLFIISLTLRFILTSGTLVYQLTEALFSPSLKNPVSQALVYDKLFDFSNECFTFSLSYFLEIALEDSIIRQNLGITRNSAKVIADFIRLFLFTNSLKIKYIAQLPTRTLISVINTITLKNFEMKKLTIQNDDWQVVFASNLVGYNPTGFELKNLVEDDKFLSLYIKAIIKRLENRRYIKEVDIVNITERVYKNKVNLKKWLDVYDVAQEIIKEIIKPGKTFEQTVESWKRSDYFKNSMAILGQLFRYGPIIFEIDFKKFRGTTFIMRFLDDIYNGLFQGKYWNHIDLVFLNAFSTNLAFYAQELTIPTIGPSRRNNPIYEELRRRASQSRSPSPNRRQQTVVTSNIGQTARLTEVSLKSKLDVDLIIEREVERFNRLSSIEPVTRLPLDREFRQRILVAIGNGINNLRNAIPYNAPSILTSFGVIPISSYVANTTEEEIPTLEAQNVPPITQPITQPSRGRSINRRRPSQTGVESTNIRRRNSRR